tara:strand:- start:87 stop:356 length:270 start_codon:yes stop_codon:yes gene_type:complete
MAKVARKGKDIAIGVVRTGRTSVYANDTLVATEGDLISAHTPGGPHTASVIVGYCPNVWAEDRHVARQGDATSCGHPITTGSSNVHAGD